MPSTVRGAFPFPAGVDNWKQLRLQIQALAQQAGTVTALYSHADPRPAAGTPGLLHRDQTTGLVSYDTGTAWVELLTPGSTITKTVRVPHTFTISGDVLVASGDTSFIPGFFIAAPAGQTVRVVAVRHRINSGTSATVGLQVNGAAITGFSALSVTTSAVTTNPADVTLADGDFVAPVVSAVAGTPRNMSLTVWLESTV